MLNERPPGFVETICPVDSKPCEGQGPDYLCNECEWGRKMQALGVPSGFVESGETYKPIADALTLHDKIQPTNYCIVDHRIANSQMRYWLLRWLVTKIVTLEEISSKSGLSIRHLTSVCLGKSGVTYLDMAKLAKALFGEQTELLVTLPWVDCGFSISEENPCPEDDECVKLLEQGQRDSTVPTKVW